MASVVAGPPGADRAGAVVAVAARAVAAVVLVGALAELPVEVDGLEPVVAPVVGLPEEVVVGPPEVPDPLLWCTTVGAADPQAAASSPRAATTPTPATFLRSFLTTDLRSAAAGGSRPAGNQVPETSVRPEYRP